MSRRILGEKLVRDWMRLGVRLAFIALAFWFCLCVLPDIITAMVLDAIGSPAP